VIARDLEHFQTLGWLRVPGAFSADAAAAMCAVIWGALEKVGIIQDDPSTWTKTRPEHSCTFQQVANGACPTPAGIWMVTTPAGSHHPADR